MYGFDLPLALSTNLVIRIIEDLICEDFFKIHTRSSDLDLGLHIQCMVAALRLLSFHIMYPGFGVVDHLLFNTIYNRLEYWKSCQLNNAQVESPEDEFKNINTDFLLIYAKDLITSWPTDKTVWQNLGTRIVHAGSAVGYAVSPLSRILRC